MKQEAKKIVELGAGEIDAILGVERCAFEPVLQASREKILHRLEMGHHVLGLVRGGRVVGTIGYSYGRFDPARRDLFPRTFDGFSNPRQTGERDSVFVYSLGIVPEARSLGNTIALNNSMLERAKGDGCVRAVCEGRPLSYLGCGQVEQNPVFHGAIQSHLKGGPFPDESTMLLDPLIALYHRWGGYRALWVVPDFAPSDTATDGLRVIMYQSLT